MFAEILLLLTALAQWTPSEQMKTVNIGDVVPSPDGKMAAWTQSRAVIDTEKSELSTHIFVGAIDGSRRMQLTRGEKSASSPQWSADSKSIYFSSDRDGKTQVYRISLSGGEAEKITSVADGIGSYEVSPDGKLLALTAVPADPERERRVREKRDVVVIDGTSRNAVLWVVASDGKGELKRLTAGARHVSGLEWSPDSRRVAFTDFPNPDADDSRHSDIGEVDVESGKLRALVATADSEGQPRYSPDGRYLAYTTANRKRGIAPTRIALLTIANGESRTLPASENDSPLLMGWMPDSKTLLYMEPRRTRGVVYSLPIDGPAKVVVNPPRGVFGMPRLSADGKFMVSSYQSPTEAPEAFALTISPMKSTKLSAANEKSPKHPFGETKAITWKSKDGGEVEGLLTLPVGYQSGQRYPMVVNIHGGPSGVFGESYIGGMGQYPIASFAAKGYAVLRPNPRGSTGYGVKFRQSVIKDWGGNDFQDIMSGVDKVVADGIADPAKLAVMGWSYGGYMTYWTVTQTDRFKAAAAGAGITNHVSMYGTQDIPSVYEDYFDAAPWEDEKQYLDRSPLFHVAKAKTPLLIIHGALDPRVPPSQASEFYTALKRRGVETQMVTYPRTQHGPREPKFVQNIMERHLDWVEKHLR